MNTTTRMSALLAFAAVAALIAACSDRASQAHGDAATHDMDASSHAPDTGVTNAPDTGPEAGPVIAHGNPFNPDKEQACKRADDAFESYLADHQSCRRDDDCTIIGDCGPNADFRSVRADAADDAYELMQARCSATYDGPVFNARCVAGRCDEQQDPVACCGCPTFEEDAGR